MSSAIGGVRIVDMPDIGPVTDDSSVVGEHAGSGRFNAMALRRYVAPRVVNVFDYGAAGDGATDDTTAFKNALVAVSNGGSLVVPAGTYVISSALSQELNGSVSFTGAGSGVTILNFIGASDGLVFSLVPGLGNIHVRGLTIRRAAVGGIYANTGLSITTAGAQAEILGHPTVVDVHLVGTIQPRTAAWAIGVSVNNVSSVSLTDVFYPAPDSNGSGLGTGIYISGLSDTSFMVEVVLNNCTTVGGSIGVHLNTWIQGVYVVNSRFIGNDYGIYWHGNNTHSDIAMMVSNTHCNSSTACVYTYQVTGITLSNMVLLHFPSPTLNVSGNWAAFDLNQAAAVVISNNSFASGAAGFGGRENAVFLQNGNTATITGNTISGINDYAISLSNQNDCTVVGNMFFNPSAPGFLLNTPTGVGAILRSGNQFNFNIDDVGVNVSGQFFVAGAGGAYFGGAVHAAGDAQIDGTLTASIGGKFGNATTTLSLMAIGPAGTNRFLEFHTGLAGRWFIGANATPEGGSNAGSDFQIISGNDGGGSLIGVPISIKRSTGVVTFSASPTFGSPVIAAASDAAAAAAGVPVGGIYRNATALQVRVS